MTTHPHAGRASARRALLAHCQHLLHRTGAHRLGRRGGPRWLSGLAVMVLLGAVLSTLTPRSGPEFVDAAATTSLSNPSLEIDADNDGVPDCWQPQGDGKSTYSFTWSAAAHTGTHAEQLTLTQYRSGSRGLFVQMGSSTCAPSVTPGRTYAFSGWYTTGGKARVAAYYRDASGAWVRWTSGGTLPTASSWRQAAFVTPAVPAGATAVSLGIELRSSGTLTTDDYTLSDTASPTASPTATATTSPTATATSSPTAIATSSPTTTSPSPTATSTTATATSSAPPPTSGYFTSLPAPGNVSALPSGSACAAAVHRSTWEPRPDNYKPNHTLVDPAAVHSSFSRHAKSVDGTYDPRWDSWLLPRVDGQFTGTTDEIIQWAACKWGLPDNYLRAEADIESTWFQYEIYPSGRCVYQYGCGDWFGSEPYAARKAYCDGLASSGGYDYQKDYGDGLCPKTFSIVGIMSWWNPSWGYSWADNQDGTFPFTRNSTAMALDFMASQIRGCYEGWQWELGSSYKAGDLWGCAGAWYSGGWHDSGAEYYIPKVQADENARPWLADTYATEKPKCDPTYGCPGPSNVP